MNAHHTCNFYCTTETHAQVLYSTGTWTAEEILEHINTYADKFSIIALAVTSAPEAPPPEDFPGVKYIDKNGNVSTTRYQPYNEGWLVTFRWQQKQTELFPATKEG